MSAIPLIVGVTGHRDLLNDELDILKVSVRDFFNQVASAAPELTLSLISPLAEGADQLVAEVAMEMNIPVTALLPMPVDYYRQDFQGAALQKFNELLAVCDVIELSLKSPGEAGSSLDEDTKEQQYVKMGAYLAAHSHILLALWDGKDSHWPGGTSRVINFHQYDTMDPTKDGDYLSPINFTEDESDLVYHIRCSRRSNEQSLSIDDSGTGIWSTRDSLEPKTKQIPARYLGVFRRMAEFNRDAAAIVPAITGKGLIPTELEAPFDSGIELISAQFVKADALARHFQSRMFIAVRTGFVLILLAGLCFIIYADLFSNDMMIYGYLIFVLAIFIVFGFERISGWKRKYLDYRVLAEALRVQFYWSLASVRSNRAHRFCHDSFHERRDLELGWIRNVMRYTGRSVDAHPHADKSKVDLVIKYWIGNDNEGQRNYYLSKASMSTDRQRLTRALEIGAFSAVMLMTLILAFIKLHSDISDILIALIGLLPFIVAVRQNYAFQTSERELITQYSYYYRIFTNAQRLIEHGTNVEHRQHVLRALGEAALDESSQWILRQKERPISGTIVGA